MLCRYWCGALLHMILRYADWRRAGIVTFSTWCYFAAKGSLTNRENRSKYPKLYKHSNWHLDRVDVCRLSLRKHAFTHTSPIIIKAMQQKSCCVWRNSCDVVGKASTLEKRKGARGIQDYSQPFRIGKPFMKGVEITWSSRWKKPPHRIRG